MSSPADRFLPSALVALMGVLVEVWFRRDSQFWRTEPVAFLGYTLYAFLLFLAIALGLTGVARLLGRILGRALSTDRFPAAPWALLEAGFLAAIAMAPLTILHIGIRHLIHPGPATLMLVAAVAAGAIAIPAVCGWLFRARGPRLGLPALFAILVVALGAGRLLLALPEVKRIALENMYFTGQVAGLGIRALDFDRDGVPGALASGADRNDFDPRVNPFEGRDRADLDLRVAARSPAPADSTPARGALAERPNLIFITMDTFAYSHTGPAGYPRATTPNIDQLAPQGVWFERCFVPWPNSTPSYASMLTGAYPHVHGIKPGEWTKKPSVPYSLWSSFDASYDTLAFFFDPDSTMDAFTAGAHQRLSGPDFEPAPAELFRWIRGSHERPFLIWIWSEALHFPHHLPARLDTFRSPPSEPISRFQIPQNALAELGTASRSRMIDMYDGALLWADDFVGQLWRLLQAEGLAERTIVVVTGDHGEAFFDHDHVGHGQVVYDEHIHVPLLFVGGGITPGRSKAMVSSLDDLPTLLDLAGLPLSPQLQGRSLLPALRGGAVESYPYVVSLGGYNTFGLYYDMLSIRTDDWKFIVNPILNIEELYDLRSDPLEERNVATKEPVRAAEMMALLKRWPGFYPQEDRP